MIRNWFRTHVRTVLYSVQRTVTYQNWPNCAKRAFSISFFLSLNFFSAVTSCKVTMTSPKILGMAAERRREWGKYAGGRDPLMLPKVVNVAVAVVTVILLVLLLVLYKLLL